MTDINRIIKQLLSNPDMAVDLAWVSDMAAEYPAFYFPAALLARRNHTSLDRQELKKLLTTLTVNCPDREALADYTDLSGADWLNFYPKAQTPRESSTDLTIDTFINTYGHSSPQEDALLERLIFSPVPADYLGAPDEPFDPAAPLTLPSELSKTPLAPPPFTGLKKPSAAPPPFTGLKDAPDKTPSPIPAPESAPAPEAAPAPTPAPPPYEPAPAPAPDTSLMESLAKFFIKKGRYERAYDIISDLSLKFPEKSVYFAEQLRFLQKKIISQKLSQENKTKKQE